MADAVGYCGGQAFSIPIDEKKYGAPFLNQGVQGGSYIYQYVLLDDRVALPAEDTDIHSMNSRNKDSKPDQSIFRYRLERVTR